MPLASVVMSVMKETRAFFEARGGGSGLPPTLLCGVVDGVRRKRLEPAPGVAELEQIVEGQEEALSAADVLSGRRLMTYQFWSSGW